MRLSESLRRDILEARVGSVVNKFKLHRRRDTFFFEELGGQYIRECEESGFSDKVRQLGREWMRLSLGAVLPVVLKKMPPLLVMNTVLKKVWQNIGLMDDFHVEKEGDVVRMWTKNEGITRVIGRNSLTTGSYIGIINTLLNREAEPLEVEQEKGSSSYVFRLTGFSHSMHGRDKKTYAALNSIAHAKGYSISDAMRKHMFILKNDNRMYFRGKLVSPMENTLFHLM